MAADWRRSSQEPLWGEDVQEVEALSPRGAAPAKEEFAPVLTAGQEEEIFGRRIFWGTPARPEAREERSFGPLEKGTRDKVWLEGCGCGGELWAFLEAFPDKVRTRDRWTLPALSSLGDRGYERIAERYKRGEPYFLIVSGGLPAFEPPEGRGQNWIVSRRKGRTVTASELIFTLARRAQAVIAFGTCAAYGGMAAWSEDPFACRKGSISLPREKLICLPGCPADPELLLQVLTFLEKGERVRLDGELRPAWRYGEKVHGACPRRGQREDGLFACVPGGRGCSAPLGCRGPSADAPGWDICRGCLQSGLCAGCTEKDFPAAF